MIVSSPILATLPAAPGTNPLLGVMLAAFDTFWVVIAFAIGSAIVNWLQKRKVAADDQDSSVPHAPERTGPASREPKSLSWEEELRRLLEGDAPVAPPAPPPLVERRPAPTVKPPGPARARVDITQTPSKASLGVAPVATKPRPVIAQAPANPARPPVRLTELSSAHDRIEQMDENVQARLDRVAAAASAFQKASGLDVAIADRMSKVTGLHVAQAARVKHKAVLPDVAQAVAMFSHRNTARQAVIVSLILGTPRGLEEQPALF